jgi:hypothetical protein
MIKEFMYKMVCTDTERERQREREKPCSKKKEWRKTIKHLIKNTLKQICQTLSWINLGSFSNVNKNNHHHNHCNSYVVLNPVINLICVIEDYCYLLVY